MRLFLLMLGNDEPAVAKAVAVIRSLAETRRKALHTAFAALIAATLAADILGLAILAGSGQ